MKHYHSIYLHVIAFIALLASLLFLSTSKGSPVAVPAGLTLLFLGLLGGATASAVRAMEKRLEILEQASLARQMPPASPAEHGATGTPPGSSISPDGTP